MEGANDRPTARDDTGATDEDTAVTVSVLGNDTEPDAGDTLTISKVLMIRNVNDPAGQGSATTDGTTMTYDPGAAFQYLAAGESATVSVEYEFVDSFGGGKAAGTGRA